MEAVRFRESIAVANVKPFANDQTTTRFTQEVEKRCKSGIRFGPTLVPSEFGDLVICYGLGNTRRRYKSTVEYTTGHRPRGFFEICYLLPRRATRSYRSECEVSPAKTTRRWFSTSVDLAPREIVRGVGGGSLHITNDDVFHQPEAEVAKSERRPRGVFLSVVETDVENVTASRRASDNDVNNNATVATYRVRHSNDQIPGSNEQMTFRTRMTVVGD